MTETTLFPVPTREALSPSLQGVFDALSKKLGFVPNLYATFAHSRTALPTYLALQSAPSSLSMQAREVVNLVVSQVNGCQYCLAAHTVLGGKAGFTPQQILEIRRGRAGFDPTLDVLARLVRNVALERGHPDPALVQAFLAAGWAPEQLVDTIVLIGDKTISNYLHGVTQVPVDFPPAAPLE